MPLRHTRFLVYPIAMKYLLSIPLLWLLCSCSGDARFSIEGQLVDNAAREVYLVVQNTTTDTLARATVDSRNRFHLRGRVEEPTTAFICDDNGNALTMLLTEPDHLTLSPLAAGGYIAQGGPINDKYNLIVQRLSNTARQIMELDPESESYGEEYESLAARYQDILFTGISDNRDNIIGVELFLEQESRTMSAEDMRVRFGQFSPRMQSLEVMQQFSEYIDLVERTEVGQPFVDLELSTTTGIQTLEQVCQGRWVLLDFWATWCEPCLQEMPTLKQAYERYAINGFEVCAVSLDRDQERWLSYIAQNDLLWTNAIDSQDSERQSAVDLYGLHTIPANYLISPEGIIVARNLYGEGLLHELEHIFEQ